MKLLLSTIFFFLTYISFSQCVPSQDVMNLGDPESDGVLNPWFLEVHAGQEVDATVTVLSPPGGEGEIGGFLSVPYTMNYFIVNSLNNMPSWVSYDCPNNCRFDVDVYSCVHVTGTAPDSVPVGDSTIMNVIVDANVDASWGPFTWNNHTVEDEDGGTLSIRYVESPEPQPNSIADDYLISKIFYDGTNQMLNLQTNKKLEVLNIYNAQGILINNGIVEKQYSLVNQPKGIYIIEIATSDEVVVKKIVKY